MKDTNKVFGQKFQNCNIAVTNTCYPEEVAFSSAGNRSQQLGRDPRQPPGGELCPGSLEGMNFVDKIGF